MSERTVIYQRPFLSGLLEEAASQKQDKPTEEKSYDLLEQLKAVPLSNRHNILMTYLQTEVTKVLGLGSSQLAKLIGLTHCTKRPDPCITCAYVRKALSVCVAQKHCSCKMFQLSTIHVPS